MLEKQRPSHLPSCDPLPTLCDTASFCSSFFTDFLPTSVFHSACKQAQDSFTPPSKSSLNSHPLILSFSKPSPSWLLEHHIFLIYLILFDLFFLFSFSQISSPRFYLLLLIHFVVSFFFSILAIVLNKLSRISCTEYN